MKVPSGETGIPYPISRQHVESKDEVARKALIAGKQEEVHVVAQPPLAATGAAAAAAKVSIPNKVKTFDWAGKTASLADNFKKLQEQGDKPEFELMARVAHDFRELRTVYETYVQGNERFKDKLHHKDFEALRKTYEDEFYIKAGSTAPLTPAQKFRVMSNIEGRFEILEKKQNPTRGELKELFKMVKYGNDIKVNLDFMKNLKFSKLLDKMYQLQKSGLDSALDKVTSHLAKNEKIEPKGKIDVEVKTAIINNAFLIKLKYLMGPEKNKESVAREGKDLVQIANNYKYVTNPEAVKKPSPPVATKPAAPVADKPPPAKAKTVIPGTPPPPKAAPSSAASKEELRELELMEKELKDYHSKSAQSSRRASDKFEDAQEFEDAQDPPVGSGVEEVPAGSVAAAGELIQKMSPFVSASSQPFLKVSYPERTELYEALDEKKPTSDVFELLDKFTDRNTMTAKFNKNRDRYKDILPPETGKATYTTPGGKTRELNANALSYMDGKGEVVSTGFHRSQAPIEAAFKKFFTWIMDKSKGSSAYILSLVSETDKTKAGKWDEYYISEGSVTYASKSKKPEKEAVTVKSLQTTKDGILETDELTVNKGDKSANITADSFTGWKDHGATTVENLDVLVGRLNKMKADGKEPIVVHCSAGMGRTGTIITSALIKEMVQDEKKNTLGITKENYKEKVCDLIIGLRNHGGGEKFVQTDEQLGLIFEYAAKLLENKKPS